MCAGPYSQRLLGIDEATSVRIEEELVKKVRPLRDRYVGVM